MMDAMSFDSPDISDDILATIDFLASSRPDALSRRARKALMDEVIENLRDNGALRVTLATYKGLRPMSPHACKRISLLITHCLLMSSDLEQVHCLTRKLTFLLAECGDFSILQSTVRALQASTTPSQRLSIATFLSRTLDGNSTFNSVVAVIPAVVLGFFLSVTRDEKTLSTKCWIRRLFEYSLISFASSNSLKLASPLIVRIFREDFNTIMLPVLLLKLKSHPDRIIDTFFGWVDLLPSLDPPTTECTDLFYKHLVSTNEQKRASTRSILVCWAGKCDKCRYAIIKRIVPTHPISISAVARASLFETLADISEQVNEEKNELIEMTVSKALEGTLVLMAREALSKSGDPSLVQASHRAFTSWLVLAKRTGEMIQYEKAMDYIRMPILAKSKTPSPDVLGPPSTIGYMIKSVHPFVLESIIRDLWNTVDSKRWSLALEAIISAAESKKAMHVSGVVAVYILLAYCEMSGVTIPGYAMAVLGERKDSEAGTSFMFSPSFVELISSNDVVRMLLPRCVALYTHVNAISDFHAQPNVNIFPVGKISNATRVLVECFLYPVSVNSSKEAQLGHKTLGSCLDVIFTYHPVAHESLVCALFDTVNKGLLTMELLKVNSVANDKSVESENDIFSVINNGSINKSHRKIDSCIVRRIAQFLVAKCTSNTTSQLTLLKALVLVHAGSSLQRKGRQRAALVFNTTETLRVMIASAEDDPTMLAATFAIEFTRLCCKWSPESSCDEILPFDGRPFLSDSLHEAVLSLLVSFGIIAGNFSSSFDDHEQKNIFRWVRTLCVDELAGSFSKTLNLFRERVESLSDLEVFMSSTPQRKICELPSDEAFIVKQEKPKRPVEDGEWEHQVKENVSTRAASFTGDRASLPNERETLVQHDMMRLKIWCWCKELCRALLSIRYLCSSDIEVGNECLPLVMKSVLYACTSNSTALKQIADEKNLTLSALASTVYEIDEAYTPAIAQALLISYRKSNCDDTGGHNSSSLSVSPLPGSCSTAARVIHEMEMLHRCVSGRSFVFMFPILQASLMGPRTSPGCEGALRVLGMHTELLFGDASDPEVKSIRKDMIVSVLELLRHDRCQTFHDPSPLEVLVRCFCSDNPVYTECLSVPSTGDIAPLLDERGALGSKNCRSASMFVFQCLADNQIKLLTSNLLVESRVWLNCFDQDADIRLSARNAWMALHDCSGDVADDTQLPSPLPSYATPLLPLLSDSNESIAIAAAKAFASALGKIPSSIPENVKLLCKCYINAFPSSFGSAEGNDFTQNTDPLPYISARKTSSVAQKKKSSSLKLDVASIGKPKIAVKNKSSAAISALLKPKQERSVGVVLLKGHFKLNEQEKCDDMDDSKKKIAVRFGVLRAISATTSTSSAMMMDQSTLELVTSFLMSFGLAESHDCLNSIARNALRDVIALNGGSVAAVNFLLPYLERVLSEGVADGSSLGSLPTEKVPKSVYAFDRRKEGAVVALGSVALHLKGTENESKINSTIDLLLSALKTPSENVQSSIADALSKLMKGLTQDRAETIVRHLMNSCLHSDCLAMQRGAAYGLSSAVQGYGISVLKKFEIVKQLEDACSSGSRSVKEGSLFAIELLSGRLGLLFEPYIIKLLPTLLRSFSDSSEHVRDAAASATGTIMSKLSAHGVKLVMPAVLAAFNDPSWRTKQASIDMLGAMSHLSPKQLASVLPKVVPILTEAFSDTHAKVKSSAHKALVEICTVVRNPEVSSITPILLTALTDPANFTLKALEALIETEFLHAIDAPSLALIVPILQRGLRDRSATTKRLSGIIAGNITTMINDPKDFIPYIPAVLSGLQSTLLDPIPDVRSTSAKALGSLTRGLGYQHLPNLRFWLLSMIRDKICSSAERSGAAQGLTEVLVASGSNVVYEAMRNDILPLRSHAEASTREGVLWMLTFLPPALGQGFTPLIDSSLPALISGLSDDSELVRDAALRAGRVLILSHGKVHADTILPSLEDGLNSGDHRIRVASLRLLGDLLSMISGINFVKSDGDSQDDLHRSERAQAQIELSLGAVTRKKILASVYLARSDSVHVVCHFAIQVWKSVVSVTGKTLREIMPVLLSRIIADLASGNDERTIVAGRCLGDLLSKLGDSILLQVIPVFRAALHEGDLHTRRGVCVGLTEIVNCSTKDQILGFIEIIAKVVQDALSDDDANVRKMAATGFQSLYSVVGSRILDETIPLVMVALESDDITVRHRAMNGLTEILKFRSREILPYIVPLLIQRPFTIDHAQALIDVARVSGSNMHVYFPIIIPSILNEISERDGELDKFTQVIQQLGQSICRFVGADGLSFLIGEVTSKCGSSKPSLRRESCRLLEVLIVERAEMKDFYEHIPNILRELIYRLNDEDLTVLEATNQTFTSLSKHVPAEELVLHVEFMRNLVASMISETRRRRGGVGDGEFFLPGLNMTKGLEPFIPIFQHGILYGSPVIRETAACGLGEWIALTSSNMAGPLVIKMAGPLLRIVGDRNSPNVKVAILRTLGLILAKGGTSLKAFVPQFQTTFMKALSDPSRQVRLEAIAALTLLVPLSTRIDPLIKELVSGSQGKATLVDAENNAAITAVQTASLEALAVVLSAGGNKAKAPVSIPGALDVSKELLKNSSDEGVRNAAAKVLGEACSLSKVEEVEMLIREMMLDKGDRDSSIIRHGKACAIRRILCSKIGDQLDSLVVRELQKLTLSYLSDDDNLVREAGSFAVGVVIGRFHDHDTAFAIHENALLKILSNPRESMDIHRSLAKGLCIALAMIQNNKRLNAMGVNLVDACLHLALTGAQRVQFAANDVLWMALDVSSGGDGIDRYANMTTFDNVRAIRSLYIKVLVKIKHVMLEE